MHIACAIAAHNRPIQLGLCIDRAKTQFDSVHVVGSDGPEKNVALTHGATYCYADNDDLGRKWDVLFNNIFKTDADAVVILGSNDYLDDSFVAVVRDALERGLQFGGTTRWWMIWSPTKEKILMEYGGKREGGLCGAGLTFTKEVFELLGRQCWTSDKVHNCCLDGHVIRRIKEIVPKEKWFSTDIPCVLPKGMWSSINPFHKFKEIFAIDGQTDLREIKNVPFTFDWAWDIVDKVKDCTE